MKSTRSFVLLVIIFAIIVVVLCLYYQQKEAKMAADGRAKLVQAKEEAAENAILDEISRRYSSVPEGDWFFRVGNEDGLPHAEVSLFNGSSGIYIPTKVIILPPKKSNDFLVRVRGSKNQIVTIWTFLMTQYYIQPDGMAAEAIYQFSLGNKGVQYLHFHVDTRGKDYKIELRNPPKGMKQIPS